MIYMIYFLYGTICTSDLFMDIFLNVFTMVVSRDFQIYVKVLGAQYSENHNYMRISHAMCMLHIIMLLMFYTISKIYFDSLS